MGELRGYSQSVLSSDSLAKFLGLKVLSKTTLLSPAQGSTVLLNILAHCSNLKKWKKERKEKKREEKKRKELEKKNEKNAREKDSMCILGPFS